MKRKMLGVAAVLVALGPVLADTKPAEAPAKPVTVPFELLPTGHMCVMTKINGKGPYRLIFDTGAPVTLLNNRVAKDSGLMKDKKGGGGLALFGNQGEFTVEKLEVGDVPATGVKAVVMDHPTVAAFSKAFEKDGGPIEGIVGFSFFARFRVTLDYQAKTMTFVPNGYVPPDVMQAMMAALMAKPDEVKILSPAAQWGMVAAKEAKDEAAGVTITEVLPGGPADKAGLKKGDRLLTLDGRWTDTIADLFTAAGHVKPGKPITVKVKRDGKEVELKVTPSNGL